MELFYDFISRQAPYSGDMIFLHGFLGSGSNLKFFAKKFLSEGYNIFLPDLRNHGQSPHSPEMGYRLMGEDLRELLDHRKLDQVILCGHSMGGKTAMQFASDYPNRVRKLIVLDITPDYREIDEMRQIVSTLAGIDLKKIDSREKNREELLKAQYSHLLVDFLLKNLVTFPELRWRCNLELFSQNIDFLSEKINFASPLSLPTLFVGGEKSHYITESSRKTIHDHFENVEITMIKDAGHWLHYEQPDTLYRLLKEFI